MISVAKIEFLQDEIILKKFYAERFGVVLSKNFNLSGKPTILNEAYFFLKAYLNPPRL